jgi:hypothetical protein
MARVGGRWVWILVLETEKARVAWRAVEATKSPS